MNTVIFSIYDSGLHSTALFISDVDTSITKDEYVERIPLADELKDYTDGELFDYFESVFGKDIHRIIIIENGEIYKVRYKIHKVRRDGKYFDQNSFFGYDVKNEIFLPYTPKTLDE